LIVLLLRAALGSVAVVALVAGCGAESGGSAEPAGVVSMRVSTAPTETPTVTPSTPSTTSTPTTVVATGPTEPPTVPQPTKPAVTAKTTTNQVVEYKVIPFKKRTVTDDSLAKGEKKVRTAGVNGTRRLTYRVTYVNGVQSKKQLIRQEVSKEPRTQVTVVGTKVDEPESSGGGCDPNYSGCVPVASDVDCSGGSGNGPEYVAGPIRVIGSDIYRLDSDDDGIACE
jgi:hypothetical protein